MIRRQLLLFAPGFLLGMALAAGAGGAQASAGDTVAAAKAAGQAGEMADGFLGLVTPSVPPEVKAAVDEVNAGRAQAYKDIAAKSGVTEQAAGEAAARTLFARLSAGYYYKPLGGGWTRK